MNDNTLQHHGILGMKWGVRRYQNKDGTLTSAGKARKKSGESEQAENKEGSKSSSKKLSEMSDSELKDKIARLKLEKEYKTLSSESSQRTVSRGEKFVTDVLETAGKNIMTQTAVYLMGATVNSIAGEKIVNPKKGQKNK